MTVVALVVTYNRRDLLMGCLEGVFGQSRPPDRVFLVDNASTDGTPELLRERGFLDRPELTYLRLAENLGSSGGFAEGVRAAREPESDWLWLMDDDSQAEPDTLERLLAAAAAADTGTVALCAKV
ncbi:MAG: glycosyltransferase, partial [Thermoleophilaceae bacterium]